MILHFDADAFFASVEQAADVKLRGRPVAVGGERRGIIASASYEARKMGIYTPMPTSRARKLCPKLIVLPCDFDKYETFSRLMFSYAYDFTPIVEHASIDECYLDLHGAKRARASDTAATIQKAIAQSLKLSVSVGVGMNKLVSQIASKLRKPHCFIEVPQGDEQGFLWPLENKWLPGVGPSLATSLNTAGLRTVEHVAATPVDELCLLAGSGAPQLHEYALGNDTRPVICGAPDAKSYGEQDTFHQDTTDTAFIIARLRAMADTLMRRVREDEKTIRTVTLRLRYNDMDEVTRSLSLDEPTDLEHDVYPLLTVLLKRAWERRVSVRLIGLRFSKVYESWFRAVLALEQSDITRERNRTLALVVDELRRGHHSIMRGHDLFLAWHKNQPREALPKPAAEKAVEEKTTNRVLRERHDGSAPHGPQILSNTQQHTAPVLNVKSCYNFLDSTLTIPAIIEAASAYGVPALALTDSNLHAAVPFHQAAKAAGIKPIIAAELHCITLESSLQAVSEQRHSLKAGLQQPARRILAYVENTRGYQNLCRLLSFEKGARVLPEQLAAHHEGLIILDADIPDVALPEIRYGKPADKVFYDVLQSMRTLTLLRESHKEKRRGDFAFHAPDTWSARHSARALDAARELAARCEFEFDFKLLRFPRYTPPDGTTPAAFLRRLAHEGLQRRYGAKARQHTAQLNEELCIIGEVGYEEYFLTVWDLLQECKTRGITWITRGSAADSLVCYCLFISNVCPVRFELYFRRFLNRERMAMQKLPDIDIDFPHDRKDDVVNLLLSRHGSEHAAVVGGFNTFQGRSALADIAKVLGVAESEVRRLTRHMPWTNAAHAADAVAASRESADGSWEEEPVRTALTMARMLDGFPRHAKMHPCGVVLSRDPIRDLTPTFVSGKGWPTTHFDMDAVEAVGLIKLDILAQGGLAVLRDAQITLRSQGLSLDLEALEVGGSGGTEKTPPARDSAPWSDAGVWEMIATGNARGVHHIESPAMTSLACMAAVRDIDRLIAIVSVIRPGAANGLKKEQFARRAQGLEPVDYTHPSLEPVLRTTFGVVAYEEHVLQICEAFAGLNAGRANLLRRALTKQDAKKVASLCVEFVEAARALGREESDIEKVWQLVAGFHGYAFCRAHSTAYGVEAYEGAYLKHYHPAEFMAGVLTNGKGFYSTLVYTLECRRLGIGFLPPDVNASTDAFTVEPATPAQAPSGTPAAPLGKAIRVPLRCVKELSAGTLERWRTERARAPFSSLRDFHERVRPECSEALNLIRVGAFDSLGTSRTEHFWRFLHCARDSTTGADWLLKESREETLRIAFREEPSPLQKLQDEMELLGFTVSSHPLDLHPTVAWSTYCPIAELHRHGGKRVTVCGLIIQSRFHLQHDGQAMKFLSLCDYSGMVECEMFAIAYRNCALATVRYPVVQVTAEVTAFDNAAGFTLNISRAGAPRMKE